ncbi:putative GDP-fucose protein O-fucosyltransferase [Helianthus annuus]|nr:putative GDP-fucose protein O-fucosyltransferase [Helianthus annuus]
MKDNNSSPDLIGPNAIKIISNVGFSIFVFSVLMFTILAITYQPPDPWESSRALTRVFTEVSNATFQMDNSVVKTGEDVGIEPVSPAAAPENPPVARPGPVQIPESVSPSAFDGPVAQPGPLVEKSAPRAQPGPFEKTGDVSPSASIADGPVARPGPFEKTDPVSPSASSVDAPVAQPGPFEKTGDVSPFASIADAPVARPGPFEKTGPVSPSASPADAPVAQPGPLVEKPRESVSIASDSCDDKSVVNCSAPGVLRAIKKFNVKRFRSIVFLEYQTPVNGSNPNECDVTWRYRNRKERSWRKYRDFRRFKLGYGENCTYKVVNAKGWHSGVNARRPRSQSQLNATRKGEKPKIVTTFRDDQINDTIPVMGSGIAFRNGKYLYYSRGGDYCKNMNQYIWSLLCALGEARYLNRTFVMDLNVCLSSKHTSSNRDEEGKDFRFYFDFEHLKETASIVEEQEFLKDRKKFEKNHKKKIPVRKVTTYKVTPTQLKNDKSTIIWRRFDKPEPENYWYRVCENQAANYIKRPWQSLWKSKRIMNIVSEISGQMDWDYDAVHVIRGEKAQNKAMWPHLNEDTSPESLVSKLQGVIQPWRNLYIATNEPFYNYFDRLRSYYKVHLLDDYKELWGDKSEWYNETLVLNGGRPVVFDGCMRAEVDTEVLYRAKTRVETFYNLTKDCKDGIHTC